MVNRLLISNITSETIIQYDRRYPAQHHRFTSRVNTKTNTRGMGHNILCISLCEISFVHHIPWKLYHCKLHTYKGYRYCHFLRVFHIEEKRCYTNSWRLIVNGKLTLYLRSLCYDDVIQWDKPSCVTMVDVVSWPLTCAFLSLHLHVSHVLKAFT